MSSSEPIPFTLEGPPEGPSIEKTKTQASEDFHNTYSEARPDVFRSVVHEICAIFVLAMAPMSMNISMGALQMGYPQIAAAFSITEGPLTWTMSAFTLASGSFLLMMGNVADTFSRRWVLIVSFAGYAIFSLACGFTKNFVGFCILRALQGICSAAAIPSAIGILGSTYRPGIRKNRVMAAFAGGAPVGYSIGTICGGICTEFISWESILFFLAILYGICAIAAVFSVPNDPPSKEDIHDGLTSRQRVWGKIKKFDWVGNFLALTGLTLFTFGLTESSAVVTGWKTSYVIACLVIGVFFIAGFLLYETYVAANPIMPMSIWKAPQFGLCMAIAGLGWLSYMGVLSFYTQLYFQKIKEVSPILNTAYCVPLCVFGLLVNVVAAFVMHRVSGRVLMIIAFIGYSSAQIMWVFIPLDISYWAIPFPSMFLAVLGCDFSYNVGNMCALSSVPKRLQSSAGGVFNTIQQLSTTIGLAASAAVVSHVVPNSDVATKQELLKGYHAACWFGFGLTVLGLFLSFFLKIGTQGKQATVAPEVQPDSENTMSAVIDEDYERDILDSGEQTRRPSMEYEKREEDGLASGDQTRRPSMEIDPKDSEPTSSSPHRPGPPERLFSSATIVAIEEDPKETEIVDESV